MAKTASDLELEILSLKKRLEALEGIRQGTFQATYTYHKPELKLNLGDIIIWEDNGDLCERIIINEQDLESFHNCETIKEIWRRDKVTENLFAEEASLLGAKLKHRRIYSLVWSEK